MPTPVMQARRNAEKADPAVKHAMQLWQIANGYGFHPTPSNYFENESMRSHFSQSIDHYLRHHLVFRPDAPCTPRTLRFLTDLKRKSFPRKETLGLQQVNELTLAWSAYLLLVGYRHITEGEALNTLKILAIQLLERFGYELQPLRAMLCPILNVWENEKDWSRILSNDTGIREEVAPRSLPIALPPVCKECIEEHLTVQ